jgi:hypothetical protein
MTDTLLLSRIVVTVLFSLIFIVFCVLSPAFFMATVMMADSGYNCSPSMGLFLMGLFYITCLVAIICPWFVSEVWSVWLLAGVPLFIVLLYAVNLLVWDRSNQDLHTASNEANETTQAREQLQAHPSEAALSSDLSTVPSTTIPIPDTSDPPSSS